MTWTTPVTNRTSTDRYNFSDLNRAEANAEHLRDYLQSIGVTLPSMTFITNRTSAGYDTVSSVNRFEGHVSTLKEKSYLSPPDWQSSVSWTYTRGFTYLDANRWEKSVSDLYEMAQSAFDGYRYSGTFDCGQEGSLP